MSIKKEHLKDIDFRTREERQKEAIPVFKEWYGHLTESEHTDLLQGQQTMLSAVLWHLLPRAEYKRLVTDKYLQNKQEKLIK